MWRQRGERRRGRSPAPGTVGSPSRTWSHPARVLRRPARAQAVPSGAASWRSRCREIVGVPEATSFDIAFLRIPGSETQVELLEYRGIEKLSGATPPSRHGTGHFCVFVQEIDALYEELAAQGVRFKSEGPVEMRTGPNKGGKSLYALDPDGYVFEFHQRPPRVD